MPTHLHVSLIVLLFDQIDLLVRTSAILLVGSSWHRRAIVRFRYAKYHFYAEIHELSGSQFCDVNNPIHTHFKIR